MASRHAELFGDVPEMLRLANPISADLDVMRPSVLANLVLAAGRNIDRGLSDFGLFELGPAYLDDTPDGQLLVAAGIRQGDMTARHWSRASRAVDAIDAKGDALAALTAASAPTANLQTSTDAPAHYHPGRSAGLRLGKNVLAWFGELHPGVLHRLDVRGPMVGFEVFLDRVPARKDRGAARAPPAPARAPSAPTPPSKSPVSTPATPRMRTRSARPTSPLATSPIGLAGSRGRPRSRSSTPIRTRTRRGSPGRSESSSEPAPASSGWCAWSASGASRCTDPARRPSSTCPARSCARPAC